MLATSFMFSSIEEFGPEYKKNLASPRQLLSLCRLKPAVSRRF